MGNSYLCYCKKIHITEENNVVRIEGIESTQQTGKKDNNIIKTNKKKYGRAASFIKGHRNHNLITDERTSSNSPQSKKYDSRVLPKTKQESNLFNNVVRKKLKSHTMERRSVFLNRTFINTLIIGAKNVGKTSFGIKISKKKFKDNYNESNIDENYVSKIGLENRFYNISFHIPLEENLNEIINNNMDYYILMYDLTDKKSFEFVKGIYEKNLVEKMKKTNDISNIIFVGNKIDIGKVDDEIIKYCDEKNISHFEISIKNNLGCIELSQKITEDFDINEFLINK